MAVNLCLGTHDELYLVNLDLVMYFQADDHYSHVCYASGVTFMLSHGLLKIESSIAEQYPLQSNFYRLGRKYIINTSFLFHVNTIKQIVMLTDMNGKVHSLHISKPALRELIDMLGDSRNK